MVYESIPDSASFLDFKDITLEMIIKYAILQTLRLQTEDTEKFALSVENIESLVLDELDMKDQRELRKRAEGREPRESYFEELSKKTIELDTLYGRREDKHMIKIRELAQFKFRLLMRHIKEKMPIEVVGVI